MVAEGVISKAEAVAFEDDYRESLDKGEYVASALVREPNKTLYVIGHLILVISFEDNWDTGVDINKLKAYGEKKMAQMPEGYELQRQVQKWLNSAKPCKPVKSH